MKLPFTFPAIEKLLQDSQWELLQFLRMILTPIPYNTNAEIIAKLERLTAFFTEPFTSKRGPITQLICLDHVLCVFVSNDISFKKLQTIAADLLAVYQARLAYLHQHQQHQDWESMHDNLYEKSISTDPSHYPIVFIHNDTLTQCIEIYDKDNSFFSKNKQMFKTNCLPADSYLLARAASVSYLHPELPGSLELFFRSNFLELTTLTHINPDFFHTVRNLIYDALVILRAQPVENIVIDRQAIIADWTRKYYDPRKLIYCQPHKLIGLFHVGLICQALIQQEMKERNSAFLLLMRLLLRHDNPQDLVNICTNKNNIFYPGEINPLPVVQQRLLELDTELQGLNIYPLPEGLCIYSNYLLPQQQKYSDWFANQAPYALTRPIIHSKYTEQMKEILIKIFSKHKLIVEPIPRGLTIEQDKHNWRVITRHLCKQAIDNTAYILDCVEAHKTFENSQPQTLDELKQAYQFADDEPRDLQTFIVRERTKESFREHPNELMPSHLGLSYYLMLQAIASTISDLIMNRALQRYKEELLLQYGTQSDDFFNQENQFYQTIRQIVNEEVRYSFSQSLPCNIPNLNIVDFLNYIEFTYEKNIDLCNPNAMESPNCQMKNHYDLVRSYCQNSSVNLTAPAVIRTFYDITQNDYPTYTVNELKLLVTIVSTELKSRHFLSVEQLDMLCRKIPEKISNFFIYRERQLKDKYHLKSTQLLQDWQNTTDNKVNTILKQLVNSPILFKAYCLFLLQQPCVVFQQAQFLELYYSKIIEMTEDQIQREKLNAACEPIWLNKIECFKAKLSTSKAQSQFFRMRPPVSDELLAETSNAFNLGDIQGHYISEINKLAQWLDALPTQPRTSLLSWCSKPPFKSDHSITISANAKSLIRQIRMASSWEQLECLIKDSTLKSPSSGDLVSQQVRATFANAALLLVKKNHELIESPVFKSASRLDLS